MGIYRVSVELPHDSGLPEDVTVNTYHFEMAELVPGSPDDVPNVLDMIQDFYGTMGTGQTAPLAQYLSPVLTGQGIVTGYRLADPEPRVPRFTATQTYGTGGAPAGGLPSECAIRVSFTADPESGTPPARLRGGPFIGPLAIAAKVTAGIPRVDSTSLANIAAAAANFVDASLASVSNKLVIYSPTGGFSNNVTGGFVDNAFDVIRSRGEKATVRTTF